MVEYMEKNFGDRALNGDQQEAVILKAKIAELEAKLLQQASKSTAEETKKDANSEDETDSDVSKRTKTCPIKQLMTKFFVLCAG